MSQWLGEEIQKDCDIQETTTINKGDNAYFDEIN